MGLLEQKASPVEEINPFPNICIYGPAGAGKTTLASEAPSPAWLDYEDSTDIIKHMVKQGKLNPAGIGIWKPASVDESWELAREIIKSKKHETIVIDTSTRMQVMQMRQFIQNHPTVKPTGNGKATRDEFTVFQADYGNSYRVLDKFYDWLCKQPIRVIILTHAKEMYKQTTDEKGQSFSQLIKIEPDLTPKLTKSLQELFSVVGYLTAKPGAGNVERKLRVNPSNIIVAKNRLGIQEQEITNPTYKRITD